MNGRQAAGEDRQFVRVSVRDSQIPKTIKETLAVRSFSVYMESYPRAEPVAVSRRLKITTESVIYGSERAFIRL